MFEQTGFVPSFDKPHYDGGFIPGVFTGQRVTSLYVVAAYFNLIAVEKAATCSSLEFGARQQSHYVSLCTAPSHPLCSPGRRGTCLPPHSAVSATSPPAAGPGSSSAAV